jgi:hypothetical protein
MAEGALWYHKYYLIASTESNSTELAASFEGKLRPRPSTEVLPMR